MEAQSFCSILLFKDKLILNQSFYSQIVEDQRDGTLADRNLNRIEEEELLDVHSSK